MMISMRARALNGLQPVAAAGVFLIGLAAPASAQSVKLAPHRAVYDVTLGRSAPGSGVNELAGRMVYELRGGACEDYAQTMRFVTKSSSNDGTEQTNDMRTTSSEDATGQRLTFNSTQYRDDQLGDITEGSAGRRSNEVSIRLEKPEVKTLTLPASTYFPIQHSIAMLQQAMAGKDRFLADVYDGSDKGDKVSATVTMIGKQHVGGDKSLATPITNADRLSGLRYWPISTGYFEKNKDLDAKDALPNYEMAANFYENGVSTRLVMDYGDFSLKGELKELTFLDTPTCAAGK